MIETFYRILLSNESHMWELDAGQDTMSPIRVGTEKDCDFRLLNCAGRFSFDLCRSASGWNIAAQEDVQIFLRNPGEAPRQVRECQLGNRMQLSICVQVGNVLREVLAITVDEQIRHVLEDYDQRISMADARQLTIGGLNGSTIQLQTEGTLHEQVRLTAAGNGCWMLEQSSGQYNVYVNVTLLSGSRQIRPGDFLTIGDVRLQVNQNCLYLSTKAKAIASGMPSAVLHPSGSALQYPIFIRSSRIQHQVETDEITVQQPAAQNKPENENMLLRILPTVTMMLTMLLMRGMMSSGSNRLPMLLYVLVSMGSSIGVMFATRMETKKKAEENEKERKNRYYNYIKQKIDEIALRRQDELRILNRIYRSTEDNLDIVRNFSRGLFDRAPVDSDFLDIRLGRGEREAVIKVKTNEQEYRQSDDELLDIATNVVNKYKMLDDAPVVARLNSVGAIGVVGQRTWLYEMLKNMTVDLTVRHYYKELRIYYVIGEEDQEKFRWARWLKNCFDSESGTYRNILCDEESTKFHLEVLYRILSERSAVAEDKRMIWPEYFVIFVYRVDMIRNHPISQFFEHCTPLGVRFIFMDEHEERIPRGCAQMVELDRQANAGSLIYTVSGEKRHHFTYANIMEEWMYEIVNKLCRVEVVESNLANEMAKSITLYNLLGIQRASDLDIGKLWSQSKIEKSMAVPLGVKTKNVIQYLDIHEKAHGPHGLVAGTTGSGKSEIMQTYLINLALYFPPDEVSFLLIDFKGGGMSNLFTGLPHLTGTITDIDGREIDRSLKSIRAELERRKELFAKAKVNKIDDYIKEHRAGNAPVALPHLIIVVDEFAELKAEQPDFMKELVSAARVGRSLGVHLILATQKPSGVVDAQIWSNSRFKLCLKVASKEDSQEMIKTPLAAEIREPGRAYLQVGNNEVFELFQSGYSGGPVPNIDPNVAQPFVINELNMWGKATPVYRAEAKKNSNGEEARDTSQLEVLVKYVADYFRQTGLEAPPKVCLPPLPDKVYIDNIDQNVIKSVNSVVVYPALYDDPERHYQGAYEINLSQDNTFIIGSAQMGKTMTLSTIIYTVIMNYSPADVNFYIIDAGTMALKMFENSKFVGGVADVHEEDRIVNMIKMIQQEIITRRNRLMEHGVGTYAAYLETGAKDMPLWVLVIDNIAAFREYFEHYDDMLQSLGREGIAVGITMMITGSAHNNLNYRIAASFGKQFCLSCNDTGEYYTMTNIRGFEPHRTPGCALAPLQKRWVEVQFALPLEADSEKELREGMLVRMAEREKQFSVCAQKVPVVPKELKLSEELRKHPDQFKKPYEIVLGMEYSTVEYVTVNLDSLSTFIVSGRPKYGKSNIMRSIVLQVQQNIFIHRADVYVFDGPKRKLYDLRDLGCVKTYASDMAQIKETINELHEVLEEREHALFELEDGVEQDQLREGWVMKLVLINDERLIKAILADRECAQKLDEMCEMFGRCRVCVIWGGYPNLKVGMVGVSDLQKYIASENVFLFFDTLGNLRLTEVTLQALRQNTRPLVRGDAYWHVGDDFRHIKTLLAE